MPQKKKVIKKVTPKKKEAPKPIRKQGEGPLQYYKRWKKWSDNRPGMDRKPVKPATKPSKKEKPKKKLTEREKRIAERKAAEALLDVGRGWGKKPKPKKPPKKKPPKKKTEKKKKNTKKKK